MSEVGPPGATQGGAPHREVAPSGALDVLVPPSDGTDTAEPDHRSGGGLVVRRAPALGWGGWIWRIVFVLGLLASVVAVPVLAWVGKDAALETTSGKVVGVVTDPEAPNYQVLVEPTPTLLLVQTGEDESLESVTFLAVSSDATGSALFLPPATAIEGADGPITLHDAYDTDGLAGLTAAVEDLLGVGIAEFDSAGTLIDADQVPVVVVDDEQLALVTAPVAPITVDNPDAVEVTDADGAIVASFPEGPVALESQDVGSYLGAREEGSNDLNRMLRHQVFWEAWIEAVRASGDEAAVAGRQSGLGRFVRTFADGDAGFVPLDAQTYNIPGASEAVFLPNEEWLGSLVPAMVPFPRATEPGERPTVEVLDGTGTPNAAITVARQLAADHSEIRAVGNGPAFDYVGTQILYYDPSQEAAAEAVRESLGTGTVVLQENPDEVVSVTVILGTDVVDQLDL